jgi:membrane associated rhomboid family serine protease
MPGSIPRGIESGPEFWHIRENNARTWRRRQRLDASVRKLIPIQDNIPARTTPFVTWGVIALNVLIFLFELSLSHAELKALVFEYGIVPADYPGLNPIHFQPEGYRNLLTNMFLHGGFFHLLFNMWMLYIFGDNVEDRMGKAAFLAFYLLCGLLAALTHVLFNAGSTVPAIGASGAIAGVMAAYALLFPRSGVLLLIPVLFLPLFVEVSAFFIIGLWFLIQIFSGLGQYIVGAQAGGGVAFWSHVGGFVAGLLLHRFFVWRKGRKFFPDEFIRGYFRDEPH